MRGVCWRPNSGRKMAPNAAETETLTKEQTRSVVGSVIEFEPLEKPPWHKPSKKIPSVIEMVKEIVEWQKEWAVCKEKLDLKSVEKVKRDFLLRFIYHVNTEEGHGCQGSVEEIKKCLHNDSSQRTVQEQETINILNAFTYLKREVEKEEENLHGFLEMNLLQEVHKVIFENVLPPLYGTPPGKFSGNRRVTTWKGKLHEYQHPPDMKQAVQTLLDRYNSLLNSVKNEEDEEKRVYKLFKVCSWLVFEFLDLHPFGDGNGRLCRLLCSYVLSIMTPFPTPIYNVWSESSRGDYEQALVDTRECYDRQPRSLTTMIIECNWRGWEHFMSKCKPCMDRSDAAAG